MRRRSILIRAAKSNLLDNTRNRHTVFGIMVCILIAILSMVALSDIHIFSFSSLSKPRSGSRLGSAGDNLKGDFPGLIAQS